MRWVMLTAVVFIVGCSVPDDMVGNTYCLGPMEVVVTEAYLGGDVEILPTRRAGSSGSVDSEALKECTDE